MKTNSRTVAAILTIVLLGWAAGARAQTTDPKSQSDEARRVREAAEVFTEIMRAPDKAIPQAILDKAEAIAVFPNVIKAAFVVGGERGKGIISVRNRAAGTWSTPAFLTLTAGSWGAQIGGQSADLVLVVLNRRGVDKLMQNQFKIGGQAEASAGPVGRQASVSTDIQMHAEILSYSRSRGLFAGVSLSGASVHEDIDANESFYGQRLHTREVTTVRAKATAAVPQAVAVWRDTLNQYSLAATSGRKDDK
jgi:SH3 domain-containing YSC84-like protein 1